jgi:hypothetical protein
MQWDFFDFLVRQARQFPTFDLRTQHGAVTVIADGSRITGVEVAKRTEKPCAFRPAWWSPAIAATPRCAKPLKRKYENSEFPSMCSGSTSAVNPATRSARLEISIVVKR